MDISKWHQGYGTSVAETVGQQWVHQREDDNDETHIDSIHSCLSMAAVAQIVKPKSAHIDWSQPHTLEPTLASPLLSHDPSS